MAHSSVLPEASRRVGGAIFGRVGCGGKTLTSYSGSGSAASCSHSPSSPSWTKPRCELAVHALPELCAHECVFAVLALESEPVDPRL